MSNLSADQRAYAKEFRAWANSPAATGYVPVHPDTLRGAADLIDSLKTENRKLARALDQEVRAHLRTRALARAAE